VNLLAARVVLRQRPLSDSLDLALPFLLTCKRPLGVLALVTLGPIAALIGFLRIGRHWSWPGLWLICLGASLLVEGVFTVALGELLFKNPAEVRVRSFVGRYLRRLPAIVTALVLRLIAMAIALGMLIVPLFLVAPPTIFIPEALLLEGATLGKALTRSRALARNRGAMCMGIWLAMLVLPVIAAMAVDLLCGSLCTYVLQLGRPAGSLWDDGGSGFAVVGALLAVPLGAAMRFLGYVDLRTRKEGWDIQLRFVSLAEQNALGRKRAA
jgi:hypothetical protein